MQNWKDLYIELADRIVNNISQVRWVDLWHNQVNFLADELPFPTPAVFLSFRIVDTDDNGLRVQNVKIQVDTYIYYETFADTYRGAVNQSSAVEFLELFNDVFACLHGTSGVNYSEMRRIGGSAVDTGDAGNLYVQNFTCQLIDYAAQRQFSYGTVDDIRVDNEKGPEPEIDSEPLFVI